MHCPRCTFTIAPHLIDGVEVDHCARCGGTFFDPGEAPHVFGEGARPESWKELWAASRVTPSGLRCPRDARMLQAHVVDMTGRMSNEWSLTPSKVIIDHCEHCNGMWLDPGEGKLLHRLVKTAREQQELASSGRGAVGYLFQFFTQLPLEVWNPVKRRPEVVWGLLIVLTSIFLLELLERAALRAAPGLWMLIPTQVLGGEHAWTLVTHGFLHASWFHLLGNLYFLWVFGDNVEDRLGKRDFAVLYGAALVAGGLAHLLANTQSEAPMLGASGAVAGLMGAYLVLFPRVQMWVMLLVVRMRVRVTWYLGLWLLLQIVMQALGTPGTAWMAHLGGFGAGALTALLLQSRLPRWQQSA
jgi:membrane associated rhomboid family serine protease/Zn-finger nucleic acid-binding protein